MIKDLCTSDKNASSDSPPNAFLSTASMYGFSIQGLQLKFIKYQITLPRDLIDIQTREINLPLWGSRKQFFKFPRLQHPILEERKDLVNLQIV